MAVIRCLHTKWEPERRLRWQHPQWKPNGCHIAGDGTHLLGGSVDDDHCAAVFHGLAAAYDAADLFRAGKAALGAAFAHDRLAGTSHAAHTLGVLGVHGAKAVAADGRAHLHAAHDAACVFLLGGHGAVVGAVTHDHTGFKGKVQRLAAIDGKVILGVLEKS